MRASRHALLTQINKCRASGFIIVQISTELWSQEDDMKVKDVMHNGATCVEPSTPVREIARRMREGDVGALPVKGNGHLVGIITDRDVACRALADSGDLDQMAARDVMTKDVVCCSPDDDIDAAVEIMEAKQIRRLPVIDGHKTVIGMLSLGDISHKLGKAKTGEVLRAVSAHHV
jgi:CBS domain-containing protein